jgi:hypothetical protein
LGYKKHAVTFSVFFEILDLSDDAIRKRIWLGTRFLAGTAFLFLAVIIFCYCLCLIKYQPAISTKATMGMIQTSELFLDVWDSAVGVGRSAVCVG